jgi:hypothetical protein
MRSQRGDFSICPLEQEGGIAVLVVSWLLEREYRQHRTLDADLPATYTKWLANLDKRLQQEADEANRRIIKMVVHPAEIENWARRAVSETE